MTKYLVTSIDFQHKCNALLVFENYFAKTFSKNVTEHESCEDFVIWKSKNDKDKVYYQVKDAKDIPKGKERDKLLRNRPLVLIHSKKLTNNKVFKLCANNKIERRAYSHQEVNAILIDFLFNAFGKKVGPWVINQIKDEFINSVLISKVGEELTHKDISDFLDYYENELSGKKDSPAHLSNIFKIDYQNYRELKESVKKEVVIEGDISING